MEAEPGVLQHRQRPPLSPRFCSSLSSATRPWKLASHWMRPASPVAAHALEEDVGNSRPAGWEAGRGRAGVCPPEALSAVLAGKCRVPPRPWCTHESPTLRRGQTLPAPTELGQGPGKEGLGGKWNRQLCNCHVQRKHMDKNSVYIWVQREWKLGGAWAGPAPTGHWEAAAGSQGRRVVPEATGRRDRPPHTLTAASSCDLHINPHCSFSAHANLFTTVLLILVQKFYILCHKERTCIL